MRFKRVTYFWLVLLLLASSAAQSLPRPFQRIITSPNGQITVGVSVSDSVRFTVSYANQRLLQPSVVAMTLADKRVLGVAASPSRGRIRAVRDNIRPPVVTKRSRIADHYTELLVEFGGRYSIAFRAYDDGVAYRWQTNFPDSITVRNETARFAFAGTPTVYYPAVQPRPDADRFHTSFEERYQIRPIDQVPDSALCFSPVLVAPVGGPRLVLTESDLLDYPGMFLTREGRTLKGVFAPYPLAEAMTGGEFPQAVVTKRADFIARTSGQRTFPWRVLIIGTDRDLPASDFVYRLATPSRVSDVSWVRPGKCTDEWITGINLFNVPFRAGVNTASYKYYVDFAKRFGFDRILLDAGWSDNLDLLKITPGLDMAELVAYARSQGVRLSMWTLAATLNRQLEPALKQFQDWGVDFIMTDFMDRDDQKMVNFYSRIADACGKARIMIMFHGAYKPAGFERTYPHAITRESVLGSEYNVWSSKATPDHDVLLPFIRMVSGPMDYEPGLLNNATKDQFRPVSGQVMSQGTRCHQLAMFIVYDSPIQIFSGNPSQAMLEPRFMEFLGSLPTAYEQTKILDAELGQYIVTARNKGQDWYIGGLTNWTARDVALPLNFLNDGSYELTRCTDGPNADRNPVDYEFVTQTITAKETLRLHLAPGGGFLLRIRKK